MRIDPKDTALADIRLLVLDFDGVMTDNRVLVGQDGTEAVMCHRGDGLGIKMLKEAGIEAIVLSTEENPVVSARCTKLQIQCVQGCNDKLTCLRRLAEQRGLKPHEVAFVGNDINDRAALDWAGVSIAPADAETAAKDAARLVTASKGGHGVVREIADWLIAVRESRDAPGARH